MKNSLKKIKCITLVLLFTVSCQMSEDLMDAMNEYNTDAMLTVTVSPGAAAVYNNDAMLVTLTPSEPEFTIKYTTDGSDPSRTAGTEYTVPFPIDTANGFTAGNIEVRVVAYDENRISNVVLRTVVLGDGTAANPFEIATALQLATAATRVNSAIDAAASFRQIADIDLSSYATAAAGTGWTPIGDLTSFSGNYDGGNFTISNLTINRPTNNQGLFGKVAGNASLQNITLSDVNITGWGSTGALAGDVNGTGITVNNCDVTGTSQVFGVTSIGGLIGYSYNATLTNCSTSAIVTGTANNAGGLIGYFEAVAAGRVVDNCSSAGQVTGVDYVGGLIGNNGISVFGATITDCSSSSTVSGQSNVGGLTGINHRNGSITNCYATGNVTGSSTHVGGLTGHNAYGTNITSSYATGDVTGTDNTGGLIGMNSSSGVVSGNNYATGNVTGANYTGGFVGYNASTTGTGNYATGDVTGTNNVGGFAGYNNVAITSCWYTTGTVTGTGSYAGGFAGVNTTAAGIITKCYSTGIVNGNSTVGGLVGNNSTSARIDRCSSRSTVSGSTNIGGLVGQNGPGAAQIYNSYSRGIVNCSGANSGGLVGSAINTPVIIYSYSTGLVTSGSGEGFIGFYDGGGATWGSPLLWDLDTSGKATSAGGAIGQNTVNMLLQATYAGYNFTAVTGDWAINPALNDGYPYLQWESL